MGGGADKVGAWIEMDFDLCPKCGKKVVVLIERDKKKFRKCYLCGWQEEYKKEAKDAK